MKLFPVIFIALLACARSLPKQNVEINQINCFAYFEQIGQTTNSAYSQYLLLEKENYKMIEFKNIDIIKFNTILNNTIPYTIAPKKTGINILYASLNIGGLNHKIYFSESVITDFDARINYYIKNEDDKQFIKDLILRLKSGTY